MRVHLLLDRGEKAVEVEIQTFDFDGAAHGLLSRAGTAKKNIPRTLESMKFVRDYKTVLVAIDPSRTIEGASIPSSVELASELSLGAGVDGTLNASRSCRDPQRGHFNGFPGEQ